MKCSNCSEEAITRVGWKDKNYCSNHFKRYFLGQVSKVLNKYNVEGEIAAALSGGKDSSTCVEVLTHFDEVKVKPFYIDLGIGDYSRLSLKACETLCSELELDLEVIDMKEKYGGDIPEINDRERGKVCGLCGMVKRYIMNHHAHENDFDYVATGHNLSDEISSTFNNLANVYLTPFRGLKPVLEELEEYRMVARLKPLYYLKDRECLIYAESNDLPYYHGECPYSLDSPTDELKEWLHELDSKRPKILRNFAKSFMRIEERMESDKSELRRCDNCGYATSTDLCRFCRVVRRVDQKAS